MKLFLHLLRFKVIGPFLLALILYLTLTTYSKNYSPKAWNFIATDTVWAIIDTINSAGEKHNEYSYSYYLNDKTQYGKCYGWSDTTLTYGDNVPVEVSSNDLTVSRIVNMNAYSTSKFEFFILIFFIAAALTGSIVYFFNNLFSSPEDSFLEEKIILSKKYIHPKAKGFGMHREIGLSDLMEDFLFEPTSWIFILITIPNISSLIYGLFNFNNETIFLVLICLLVQLFLLFAIVNLISAQLTLLKYCIIADASRGEVKTRIEKDSEGDIITWYDTEMIFTDYKGEIRTAIIAESNERNVINLKKAKIIYFPWEPLDARFLKGLSGFNQKLLSRKMVAFSISNQNSNT